MTGRDMKLTIESMTYGTDGLAHADNGKAVFVQGAVAGDTVEAEVVQDGKSFMRARTTEILEPSPDRKGAKPALHARAHWQVRS